MGVIKPEVIQQEQEVIQQEQEVLIIQELEVIIVREACGEQGALMQPILYDMHQALGT